MFETTALKSDGDFLENNNFSEKSIGKIINRASNMLRDAGIINHQAEARHLMMEFLNEDLASIYSRLADELDDVTAMRYMKAVKKRTTHYPFQYIIGYTYFMEYKFNCKEKVLIPRYDTENLVMHSLDLSKNRDMKVMDLCCGTGCIGISYYLWRKRDGYKDDVTLVDISDDAIALSKENAEKLDADVRVVQSDLFSAFRDEDGNPNCKFDMILSNPPYIKTGDINFLMKDVREFEPRLALDGSRDGLNFYRRIISELRDFLVEDGKIVFEIGDEQYMDVSELLRDEGFKDIVKLRDMSGYDRVVSAGL